MAKKIVLTLDSASRNITAPENTFSWNLSKSASANSFLSGRTLINDDIIDVKKIVIKTIDIPLSPKLEPIYNTIRCYLPYISNTTYFSDLNNTYTPFHFNFTVKYNKRCRRLILTPIVDSIEFNPPLASLQNIDLKFYDPYGQYQLPNDYVLTTISNGGAVYPLYTMFTIDSSYATIPINTGDAIKVVTEVVSPFADYNKEINLTANHNILKLDQRTFLIYTANMMPTGYTQTNVYVYCSINRFIVTLDVYTK